MSEIAYNPMSQVTSLKTGAATNNADIEQYSYDQPTGLLTNQKVIKQNSNQSLLDLSYDYQRGNSNGTTASGKTGQLTRIVDNLNHNKNRLYEFDSLGRLRQAKGGLGVGVGNPTANWTQSYSYDRYGNKLGTTASGITQNSQAVPTDGINNQYEQTSNRINTPGYEYDLAGNLTRGQNQAGVWERYEYDGAGRMTQAKDDAGNNTQGNGYTSSRQRLVRNEAGVGLTWYV